MRSLAVGPWSAAQMDAVLRAGSGRYGCRFEILDMGLEKIGDLENVLSATVRQDVDDDVKQQIELELLPDDRLVDMTFRRYVKAYFRVGMPNQTEVEYPLGVYLWARPRRQVDAKGIEKWLVTLGDRNHLLDLGGPPPSGFTIKAGARITYELRRILARMGMDTSGVVPSDETAARELLFDQRANVEAMRLMGVKADAEPVTWLKVAHRLTDSIGYQSVYFDGDGQPIMAPAPNLNTVDPDVTFETNADSILLGPLETDRDLSQVANRVTVRCHAPNGAVQVITVTADQYMPNHPLTFKKIGLWIDVSLDEPIALSNAALRARAIRALQRRLSGEQLARIKTLAWPVHESFDVVNLQWDGDEDYDIGKVHHEKAWALDLFTGNMEHTLRRLFRAE